MFVFVLLLISFYFFLGKIFAAKLNYVVFISKNQFKNILILIKFCQTIQFNNDTKHKACKVENLLLKFKENSNISQRIIYLIEKRIEP